MQAIITRYLAATNTRSSRVKAQCARGSITLSYPHDLSGDAVHAYAAEQLCRRFVTEDSKQYGSPRGSNPWAKPRTLGTLPSGDVAHVFSA